MAMRQTMINKNSPLGRRRARRSAQRTPGRHTLGLTRTEEKVLDRLLREPMDYIDSDEFYKKDAETLIYDEAPDIQRPDVSWYRPLMDDLTSNPDRKVRSNGTVLLSAEEERVLFLQYNYARHRVRELQEAVGLSEPSPKQIGEMLYWYRKARGYREQIAETNLALVLAMAKRTRMSEVDFADLVSEGNMALLRSVDKFDCGRGFKFSTYACRAILKAFSRQGMKLTKHRQKFPTDFDPAMEKSNHLETLREQAEKEAADEVKHIVLSNEADLSDVEVTVIHHRFGLENTDPETTPLTLEQVGQIIGVTKERVRQIQNKALEKIRLTIEANRERELEEAANPGASTDGVTSN